MADASTAQAAARIDCSDFRTDTGYELRIGFSDTNLVHSELSRTVTNMLGVVFTLGPFRPYSEIRLAKYRIGELSLVSSGRLDAFVAGAQPETTALGEGAAELLDVDFGI